MHAWSLLLACLEFISCHIFAGLIYNSSLYFCTPAINFFPVQIHLRSPNFSGHTM